MFLLELASVAIVAIYVALRGRDEPRWRFAMRMLAIAIAAGVTENLCIRLYGFYEYSPQWSTFVGHVPLMVIAIWPVVIHSAWDLSRHLLRPGHRLIPVMAGGIVFIDAALIEPIASSAGLWTWHVPGLFGVPPIAILGWALFGGACVALWEYNERTAQPSWAETLVIGVVPVVTHLSLLITWWIALRWLSQPIDPLAGLIAAWFFSAIASAWFLSERWRRRLSEDLMLARVPATLLFGGLLAALATKLPLLALYGAAFAMAYTCLTPWLPMARRLHGAYRTTRLRLVELRMRSRATTDAVPIRTPELVPETRHRGAA